MTLTARWDWTSRPGTSTPDKDIRHTHEGSIGNLCNDRIQSLMESILKEFNFERVDDAERKLLAV